METENSSKTDAGNGIVNSFPARIPLLRFTISQPGVTTVTFGRPPKGYTLVRECSHLHMRYHSIVLVVALLAAGFSTSAAAEDSTPLPPARTVVQRVAPTYPEVARRMQMSGVVKLRAKVAPNGTVRSIEALGGSPLLVQAAEDAVKNWKFAPAAQETRELIELRFAPR
jgi:TonB family protein